MSYSVNVEMADSQPERPIDEDITDCGKIHPDVDSGYGESSNQSLEVNEGGSKQQSCQDDVPTKSEACPQPLLPPATGSDQPQRISLRPILKPIDEQTAKRVNDVTEQMSRLLPGYMAKSKRRKYLSKSKRELPSTSIRPIMLGTTVEDAKIRLVIFCTDIDGTHDRIRSFLRKSFVKDLYQPLDSAIPSFDVHIFDASPNMRAGNAVEIPIKWEKYSPDSTYCGTPIYLIGTGHQMQKALATMGGILECVEAMSPENIYLRKFYGLTVAHGVIDFHEADDDDEDDEDVSMSGSVSVSSGSSTDSTTSDDSHHAPPIEIDWGISVEALRIESEPAAPRPAFAFEPAITRPIKYSAWENNGPFRDWALFDFSAPLFQLRPNMLQAQGQAPVLLKAPTSLANTHDSRSVSIITGYHGVKEATLSPCLSRILLKPGTEFVRAYSVELRENSDIKQGDSGSWVVDTSTFEVYGHLVATDMLLGSYVIPLIDIFTDIKSQSAQASIEFPSPQLSPVLKAQRRARYPGSPSFYDNEWAPDDSDVESSPVAKQSSIFSSVMTTSTGTRTSAAPSSAHTGSQPKPRLWTNSHRRKLTRAYVYTNLTFDMIRAAIDVYLPGWTPGKDSALKALNELLDKQSLWLRPTTEEDENDRLQKLAQSSRLRTQARMSTPASGDFEMQELQKILKDCSETYVQNVERLMTSYSVKSANEQDEDVDDVEMEIVESTRGSWLRDKDAPSVSSPAPVPGDFLRLDELLITQGYCGPGLLTHDTRSCLCYARDEVDDKDFVTAAGLAPLLHSDMLTVFNPAVDIVDSFGNTALHLLAARHPDPFVLLTAIKKALDPALSTLNTAHQTFLHVLGANFFENAGTDNSMLSILLQQLRRREFSIYARDVYGRSFFHVLQTNIRNQATMDALLSHYNQHQYARRDAFGVIPTATGNNEPTFPFHYRVESIGSQVAVHSRMLENIRLARDSPLLEDSDGRNGLHLIADAVLPARTARNEQSSTEVLSFRKWLIEDLLTAGVDVNHYSKDGNTVLMAFVARLPEDDDYKTQCAILEKLIESGADVDARNRSGETALHIAVRTGRKLATRTLVQTGANVYVRDGEGRSVLDVADVKILHAKDVKKYAHYEAIRAWLSGSTANTIQSPSVKQEWGRKTA